MEDILYELLTLNKTKVIKLQPNPSAGEGPLFAPARVHLRALAVRPSQERGKIPRLRLWIAHTFGGNPGETTFSNLPTVAPLGMTDELEIFLG